LNAQIDPKPINAVLECVAAVTVAWRRAASLTAATVIVGAGMGEAATGVNMNQPAIPLVAAVIAAYAIIAYAPLRRAIVGTVIVAGGSCGELLIAGQKVGNLGFIFTFVGLAWALGRITRVRTSQAVQAQLQVERLRHEQEDHARRVAADERGRIARELHDVIAHSVSVMVVQAGAAQQVMTSAPDAATRALESVQETGRQAIGELGRLLGVLRDAGELGLNPQPTLAELEQLVADARSSGLPVTLTVTGAKRPLPTGVELAVYRIVQEALTNTRKHAGPASTASVMLAYGADDIAVEVRDDGRGAAGYGTGHGLVGMRERVSTYGGTLATGRADGGGFSVCARIPVSARP
jgi:signal transduction histidine kinase